MNLIPEETDRQALLAEAGVSPNKLAHVVLKTPPERVDTLVEFYMTLLNAVPAYRNPGICFLRYDDEHHRVVILGIPGLTSVQPHSSGMEHFAFTYPSLGELLGNYARLKARGINPVWCINHGFTTSIYFQDPDGNMIETQFDNMDNDDADAFMLSEYFDKNPVGVDFDPEVLLERYKNGDPVSELIKFKSAPYAPGKQHIAPAGLPPYDANGDLL